MLPRLLAHERSHRLAGLARLLGTRGTRAVLAAKHGDAVRLLSLKAKDLSNDFPAVVQFVRPFGRKARWSIGGYNPDGNSFSSLLVGYYEEGRLMFAGKVRQGFTPALRRAVIKLLNPLGTKQCPFVNLPTSKTGHFGKGITKEDMVKLRWLEPKRVAQVSFTEWTTYGLLRHATFLGLREDKEPAEVVKEQVCSSVLAK